MQQRLDVMYQSIITCRRWWYHDVRVPHPLVCISKTTYPLINIQDPQIYPQPLRAVGVVPF